MNPKNEENCKIILLPTSSSSSFVESSKLFFFFKFLHLFPVLHSSRLHLFLTQNSMTSHYFTSSTQSFKSHEENYHPLIIYCGLTTNAKSIATWKSFSRMFYEYPNFKYYFLFMLIESLFLLSIWKSQNLNHRNPNFILKYVDCILMSVSF